MYEFDESSLRDLISCSPYGQGCMKTVLEALQDQRHLRIKMDDGSIKCITCEREAYAFFMALGLREPGLPSPLAADEHATAAIDGFMAPRAARMDGSFP